VLLDEIINLAVDSKQPITDLLRKCIVLAHQIKNDRLKTWATKELNGYDLDDKLPPYRILTTIAKGDFFGSFGRQLRNWQIPSLLMEEQHREWATTSPLIHPLSGYEELSKTESGVVHSPWNPDLVLYYQQRLSNQGYNLISAWQEIPAAGLIGMLDTVRNRILNMALEIQSEVGDKDKDLKRITPEEFKKVDQTIVNNIFGGNVYMSSGSSTMTATTVQKQQQNIVTGDWEHLERALKDAGITNPELKELFEADRSDGNQKLKESGSVMKWIKTTASKVLAGGVKVGAEVGKAVLTEMLMQYYGLKK
jgi:hypothetical protein